MSPPRDFRDFEAVRRAELCRHLDLADVGLRQHAGRALRDRRARQRDIGEFFVLERQFGALDLLVRARARQPLGEVAPVRRCKRTLAVMRAGRGDMRACCDQLLAQRDDPRIARRRAGLDDQQRVAGLVPHQLGERGPFAVADSPITIARDDEVGRFGAGERGAGIAALVSDVAQSAALSPTRSSASVRKASLASSSVKSCSDGNASAAAHVAVPGPAPMSSRLFGAKSGRISHSAFRLAATAA